MDQSWQAELLGRHRVNDAQEGLCDTTGSHVEANVTHCPGTYPDLEELLLLLLLDDEDDEEELLDEEEEEVPSRLSALCSSSSARSARSGL